MKGKSWKSWWIAMTFAVIGAGMIWRPTSTSHDSHEKTANAIANDSHDRRTESSQVRPILATTRRQLAAPGNSQLPVTMLDVHAASSDVQQAIRDPEREAGLEKSKAAAISSLYDSLVKELKLNEREAKQFLSMVQDAQERLIAAQRSEPDPALRVELIDRVRRDTSNRMLAFLGTQRFNQYEAFEKNINEQVAVLKLSNELATVGKQALSDRQRRELVELLVDAKTLPSPLSRVSMKPEEAREERLRAAEDYRQRVLERAETILSTEQLEVFRSTQERLSDRNGETSAKKTRG